MPASPEALFAWHERPGAFLRLAPPWTPVALEHYEGIQNGQKAVIRLGTPPFTLRWVAEHRDYTPGVSFTDVQVKGPFRRWIHTHRVEAIPDDPSAAMLVDDIEYDLPLSSLGQAVAGALVRTQLDQQFTYRHRITQQDLRDHQAFNPTGRALRIAMTGASGLLGQALTAFLTTGGHTVIPLVRRPVQNDETAIYWNPAAGELAPEALSGLDAVVHLAGENVFALRWNTAKKKRIYDSRIVGTQLLAKALAECPDPPKALLCASGIGYYGDQGEKVVTEDHPTDPDSFLARVCHDWEAAAEPARAANIRTVHLRIGVVLTPQGGALAQMLPPFRFGLGGRIGPRNLYLSWIALDDVLRSILMLLCSETAAGPYNLVAPTAVPMQTFAQTLGQVLHRPSLFPVPGGLLKLAMGEVAEETILTSLRVAPTRLQAEGFSFAYPALQPALRHLLGKDNMF